MGTAVALRNSAIISICESSGHVGGIMKSNPKVGTIGEVQFIVQQQHAIDFADEQMPPVLSTPWLIWFLEHAARESVLPVLEPGESTVGTQIDVQHLAPTPLGQRVTCRARIIHTDGTLISLQVEAQDEQELIARGLHKLRVIQCNRFASRVDAKKKPVTQIACTTHFPVLAHRKSPKNEP